jgi:uncharacterized protein (DUF2147 family)
MSSFGASLNRSLGHGLSEGAIKARSGKVRRAAIFGLVLAALTGLSLPAYAEDAASAASVTSGGAAPVPEVMSPVGIWRTIDDQTHEPKAYIQITRDASGVLTGKILRGINDDPTTPPKFCTACTDERKDQPMKGLTIIRNLKLNGDMWEGGDILDPENGKTYHCRIHVEDSGHKLVVRGYLGVPLLGRSQTWIRDDAATLK